MDNAVIIAAAAAWAGVIVNGIIAMMAVKDQVQLPYRLNGDQRLILQTLARNSEQALRAQNLTQIVFEQDEYNMLLQEGGGRGIETLSRRFRYNLSYLERKGAVSATFIPAQGTNLDPTEVYYRITHRGWRKLGRWTNAIPPQQTRP